MSTLIKNVPIAVTGTFGAATIDSAMLEQFANGFNRDRYRPNVWGKNFARHGEVLSIRVIGNTLYADLLMLKGITELANSNIYPSLEAFVSEDDDTRNMLCGVLLHDKQAFEGNVMLRDCDMQPYIKQEYWKR